MINFIIFFVNKFNLFYHEEKVWSKIAISFQFIETPKCWYLKNKISIDYFKYVLLNRKNERYLKFNISNQTYDDFVVACKLIENYQKEKTLIINNRKFTNSKHEFLMGKIDGYIEENYEENANKKRNAILLSKELIEELS